MGRRSEMEALVATTPASPEAMVRTKVILLTLTRELSVEEGYRRLGVKRTRFQALRRRMLAGATAALEPRPRGRPATAGAEAFEAASALRGEVARLEAEVARVRTELDLARSAAGRAIEARLRAKAVRR